jgi:hypothetical protein
MERAFHPITRDPRSGITASRAFTSGLFGASAREFRGVFSRIVHPREIYRAS